MSPLELFLSIFLALMTLGVTVALEINRRNGAALKDLRQYTADTEAKLQAELKDVKVTQDLLWKNIHSLEKRVLEQYVRKDDFREAFKDLKETMTNMGRDIKENIGRLEKQLDLFRQDGGE